MLRVYNTLGQKKEEFRPLKEGSVRMYVCGVTVYDNCHLGHARAYVSFDVIRRYLEYSGYRVTYIQNFTDIDDKIIKKAREENKSVEEIARLYTGKYFEVMDRLNIKRADFYPKATEHIEQMIASISELFKGGHAYEIDGDVYFSVRSYSPYGQLSGRDLEGMRAGARVEVDERKKDPLDFALWKKSKEGEPSWTSPWGRGRPGWHIECSAMSMKYLGETFDIHGGGLDLIFPHHENELAQAGGISGEILARYWLHNGYVTIDQEKMSKSLGNFFTLEDIFKKYEPETVRYFLLSTHYRHSIDFNEEKLKEAAISLDGLYQTFRQVEGIEKEIKKSAGSGPGPATASKDILKKELDHKFKEAMDNDFNTSMALGLMHDLSREINQAVTKWYTLKERGWEILGKRDVLQKWGEALGLFFKKEGSAEKRGKANLVAGVTVSITDDKIKELIAMRERARKNKEWKKADEIRLQLLKMGIIIEDTPMGARWYRGGLSE